MSPKQSDVWAVPGAGNIIDAIDPTTGLTFHFGRDEANVKADYPDAVRMTWDEWQAAATARQQTPIVWAETDAKSYHYMLEVLPPAAWIADAFLVGEPSDHDFTTGRPRFAAFWKRNGRYVTATRPITIAEFRAELQAVQS